MTNFTNYLAGAAAIGGIAAPLAAQQPYPYRQAIRSSLTLSRLIRSRLIPATASPATTRATARLRNPVTDVIDQLLGNRYNVTDRQAVRNAPTPRGPRRQPVPRLRLQTAITATATTTVRASLAPRCA